MYDTAKVSLGKHDKKHQDWLDPNDHMLRDCMAKRNDMKGFYSGLKEVLGPHTKQPAHLKSSDGLETFTDRKSIMTR